MVERTAIFFNNGDIFVHRVRFFEDHNKTLAMKRDYPYGTGTVKWVSTDWLYENLKKQEIVILDVQPNIHDYIEEHIPGAIYLNESLLRTYGPFVRSLYFFTYRCIGSKF